MGYRNDEEARKLRREAIERELAEVRDRIDALEGLSSRRSELEKELQTTFATGAPDRKRSLPLLSRLAVKSPCKEPWTAMSGDDHVRHCARCDKNVFDLSSLHRDEAEALLRGGTGDGSLCVRYFLRPDGTVMTSECAPAKRTKRARAIGLSAGIGIAAVFGFGAVEDEPAELMGAIAVQGEPSIEPQLPPTPTPTPKTDLEPREMMGAVAVQGEPVFEPELPEPPMPDRHDPK